MAKERDEMRERQMEWNGAVATSDDFVNSKRNWQKKQKIISDSFQNWHANENDRHLQHILISAIGTIIFSVFSPKIIISSDQLFFPLHSSLFSET